MTTIDTSRNIAGPLRTGIEESATTDNLAAPSASVAVSGDIADFGYVSFRTLASLGLPSPTNPGDLEALFTALWLAVEERIAVGRRMELEADVAAIHTTLGAFRAAIEAKVTLVPVHDEKVRERSDLTDGLQQLQERRVALEEELAKLDRKIDAADSESKKAELGEERNKVETRLQGVYEEIASLEGVIANLTQEIDSLADAISQSEAAYVMLLSMIVRDRTLVDPETENQEENRVQNVEEQLRATSESISAMLKNEVLWQELVAASKKQDVKSEEERELEFRLALTALQIILPGLPIGANGGIVPSLPGHGTDSGGRLQLPV